MKNRFKEKVLKELRRLYYEKARIDFRISILQSKITP